MLSSQVVLGSLLKQTNNEPLHHVSFDELIPWLLV